MTKPINDADLARVRGWVCDTSCTQPHLTIQALQSVIARLDQAEADNKELRSARGNGITPNKAADLLKTEIAGKGFDSEHCHSFADQILLQIAKSAGFHEFVTEYNKASEDWWWA